MRRLLGWIGGAVGGVTAYRLLRRQRPMPVPSEPEPDDRAEELRAKLAEAREAEPVVEAPEPVVEEEPLEPESPEERRQRVHEEGRATLDEMKSE
ncbi:MAG TPA: hypothetical protein VJ814_06800 [Gaiellaceae bacterium]|nr:hypothetical protein [Gaiellaceae bacterium]